MKSRLLGAVCAGFIAVVSLSTQAVPVSGQGTWESTLQGRDLDGNPSTFEAYYDTTLDITWIADANLATSNTFGVSGISTGTYAGRMSWNTANNWIAGMNTANYLGYNDWRLPSVTDIGNDGATFTNFYQGVDYGYNIDTTNGEMASLWYDTLGNTAYYDTAGNPTGCAGAPNYCLTNTGPFSNLQSGHYWSGVEYAPSNNYRAWGFNTIFGYQYNDLKSNGLYGWAVRSGDVSAVPVPAAVWLFGSGMIGMIGITRRKKA